MIIIWFNIVRNNIILKKILFKFIIIFLICFHNINKEINKSWNNLILYLNIIYLKIIFGLKFKVNI